MSAADQLAEARAAHADLLDIASAIGCGDYDERLRGLDRLQTASYAFTTHLSAALAEVDRLTADLATLRIERGAMCGEIAHIREDLDEARCERDDARDETRCLWDATEADRARMAAIESRPTYEDGVRAGLVAAGRSCRLAEIAMRNRGNVETSAIGARECALIIDEINPADILSLLEPKPGS